MFLQIFLQTWGLENSYQLCQNWRGTVNMWSLENSTYEELPTMLEEVTINQTHDPV